MTVQLVTGSRALCDTPEAQAWARGILAHELLSAGRVVAGNARGPDEWAHEIAAARRIQAERWCTNGAVEFYDGHGPLDFVHVAGWSDASTTTDPRRRPLARNAAMIAAYDPFRTHATVRLVALVAPWSRTQGTQHTAACAERAGIAVTTLTCPLEFAPKGGAL